MFYKKRIRQLEENLDQVLKAIKTFDEFNEEITNRVLEIEKNMEDYKKYEEHKALMKDSDEPWADFTVGMAEEDGRVKVEFDWNKPMIQELRRQGFSGQTEEDIISALFARLISEHGDAMSEQELEGIRNA